MRQRGFTLIEILVAMAIFALIGVAGSSVLTTVLNSDNISTERFEKMQQLQRAVITIERDIQQAVPRAVRQQDGNGKGIVMRGGESDDSDDDAISFVRSGWQNPQMLLPRSTLQPVLYRLRDNKLERLYGNYVDNVIGYEPKVRVLLENIESFKVEFIADIDPGVSETSSESLKWQQTYIGQALPMAVAVEFVSQDFGKIRREFTLRGGGG